MADSSIEWTDKTGRKLGALKRAATLLGIPFSHYVDKVKSGNLWCTACKSWHEREAFGEDSTRWSGKAATCNDVRRSRYTKRIRADESYARGWRKQTRDGDKRQARRRVNYLVEQGRIPHPNSLRCTDCGSAHDGTRRHEYDHARGYVGENQLYVEPVCSTCHHAREASRNV